MKMLFDTDERQVKSWSLGRWIGERIVLNSVIVFFFKDEDDKRLRDNIVMEETDRRSCSYLRIADMLGPSPGTEANHRCVIIVVHVPMHTRMQRGISSFS